MSLGSRAALVQRTLSSGPYASWSKYFPDQGELCIIGVPPKYLGVGRAMTKVESCAVVLDIFATLPVKQCFVGPLLFPPGDEIWQP